MHTNGIAPALKLLEFYIFVSFFNLTAPRLLGLLTITCLFCFPLVTLAAAFFPVSFLFFLPSSSILSTPNLESHTRVPTPAHSDVPKHAYSRTHHCTHYLFYTPHQFHPRSTTSYSSIKQPNDHHVSPFFLLPFFGTLPLSSHAHLPPPSPPQICAYTSARASHPLLYALPRTLL